MPVCMLHGLERSSREVEGVLHRLSICEIYAMERRVQVTEVSPMTYFLYV